MRMLNWLLNIYNFLKSLIFKVISIQIFSNVGNRDIYIKYIIVKIIKFYISMCNKLPFMGKKMSNSLNKILENNDEKYKLVQMEIIQNNSNRKIIFENNNLSEIIDKIENVNYDVNDYIMNKKCIISEINLVKENNKIPLKKIFDQYSDRTKLFDHKIKNILTLNGVQYNETDTLEIKYINFPKREQKFYNFMNIINWHIFDIYNLKEDSVLN